MALPPELKPRTKGRVMDLVQSAGVDVSEWPNYGGGAKRPGANPKYCYEWAIKEPGKVLVCNLWAESMHEIGGHVEQTLVLVDTPNRKELDPTRRARRSRMAALLSEASGEQLPIRVIVLDGEARNVSAGSTTKVKYRALDPEVWSVVSSNPASGTFVLRRGMSPAPFADQFDLPRPPDGPMGSSSTTVTVRNRSQEVRTFALRRANGRCEYCGDEGFALSDGRIYLETHHVVPLASGGLDSESNMAALCANHHREAHYGGNATAIKSLLQKKRMGDAARTATT